MMTTIQAVVASAMGLAFNLGQKYWQEADSESYSANRRSIGTRAKFDALVADTIVALDAELTRVQEPAK